MGPEASREANRVWGWDNTNRRFEEDRRVAGSNLFGPAGVACVGLVQFGEPLIRRGERPMGIELRE